ncbi:NUDIX hydrolase [Acinetobacter rathckeae]|uniref:NUDIX hydrolase n=1 Tax=Acinetobacter rathckeae TaxID=2605272 RepID=UPI0018A2E643|nr:NUDIX hydrolase [Acinetobacter rathckeae]MBF7687537.1 NUDIX hydrolase [Acinetobacter rathckeae]MBF7694939.1 NUDIX hydrolase [Acinetobacter rathckeae]
MANAWSTHVTVATVIEKDGQYLFVEEHSEGIVHTVYNQPAGHLEYNETLIAAAQRETLEETGYCVEIDHLIGIYSYTPPMAPDRTYFRFCFAAHILNDVANTTLDPDIIRTVWLSKEELELSAQARSPLVIKAIQDYEKGQKYPLSMIYEHPFSPQPTLNLDT